MPGDKWGTLLSVQTANLGEFLTADAALGATTLNVSDVRTFKENGGQIQLNEESYVYTAVDETNSTLTLFSGLLAAAVAEDLVEVVPPTPVKRALVSLDENEDEGVWATVPESLVNNLTDGLRDTLDAESVLVEERRPGELYIKDVAGRATEAAMLTVAELQNGHICVLKEVDEDRTSTTTGTPDAELVVYLDVGRWRVELFAVANGAQAGDIRISWDWTGTVVGTTGRMALGSGTGTTDSTANSMRTTGFHAFATNVPYGLDGAVGGGFREDIIMDVSSPGTLTLLWAQNTSSATPTTLSNGSRLYVTRMSS